MRFASEVESKSVNLWESVFVCTESRLHILSIVGNGLLLGTALGVVIPE